MEDHGRWKGALCGLAGAALFGVSAPLAKLLLPETGPLLLAGLLYLGGGLGLSAAALIRRASGRSLEARLERGDAKYLVGIIALGGIAGPILMLFGLGRVSAMAGSLLLNLEAPFTIVLAVVLFGDHLGLRPAIAAAFIVGGAIVLGWQPGELRGEWTGAIAIAGASACWGIDNNLTQRLSLRDPIVIVRIKALGAGACSLILAFATQDAPPNPKALLPSLLIGAVSYGLSIVLDVYALRLLGAAREAAYFATAPFVGALASIPLVGERPGVEHLAAAALMGAGVFLLVRERHGHLHHHEPLEHDHLHVHDAHHRHAHDGTEPSGEPHTHPHRHASLVHDHPHVPDLHHRHRH
jgi:drug/metabolite transporter (DMT)-like permease